ncbi:hypothetical protein GMSM_44260 [Geomonas sp. Red276]
MHIGIQRISLSEFFKFKAPTHLVGTTYTVSLMFFESAIWPLIDKSALLRCAILCDKEGFRRSLCEMVGLEQVSISYMAVPVPTPRTFHPKFWIAANNREVSILVGSGNLTQSGFMDNNELFDVVTFDRLTAEGPLIQDIRAFLHGIEELFPTSEENGRWVRGTLCQIRELLPPPPGTNTPCSMRLLHSFAGPFPEQLKDLSPAEGARLYVASPYFGNSLDGLNLLREELCPAHLVVCPAVDSNDSTANLRVDLIEDNASVEVANLHIGQEGALSHFKLYGLIHSEGSWLFNSSVNCTRTAMDAENIEAGLVRITTAATVEGYFSNRIPLDKCRYAPLPKPAPGKDLWLNIYAHKTGAGLEIDLRDSEGVALPLMNVKMIARSGKAIESASYAQAFRENRQMIPWDVFPIIGTGNGAIFFEIIGSDSAGKPVRGGNFVNDLGALSSTPGYRNAFGAALKLASAEAIPGIFEISSISAFLEELTLEGTDEGAKTPTADANAGGVRPKIEPAVPIWPPRTCHGGTPDQFGSGETCITWFQRILDLILNIEESEEPLEDDAEKELAGFEPRGGGANSTPTVKYLEMPRIWERIEGLFLRLEGAIFNNKLSPKVMPRLVPTLLVATWMLLGTRRKMISPGAIGAGNRWVLGHLENVLAHVLRCAFGHRGNRDCLVDDMRDQGIELHKDFSRIFLVLFAYLYALELRNPAKSFPLRPWLRFEDHASAQLKELTEDTSAMKRTYETFLSATGVLEWDAVSEGAALLLAEDWRSVQGLQVYRFLKTYSCDQIGKEPEVVVRAMGESISGIRLLVKRGVTLKFHSTDSLENFCTAAGCGRVEEPHFAKLKQMIPVICMRCRNISVPDVVMELDRRHCGSIS